jgi:hypothetical protein
VKHEYAAVMVYFCKHCGPDVARVIPRKMRLLAEEFGLVLTPAVGDNPPLSIVVAGAGWVAHCGGGHFFFLAFCWCDQICWLGSQSNLFANVTSVRLGQSLFCGEVERSERIRLCVAKHCRDRTLGLNPIPFRGSPRVASRQL